ncbi:MAG TPA: sigma 54-interacting transcriptional regulator [Gemmatimonadota bacterium]|nr:sigma 54-interacting transcriptional regulator [Gemmatimonadota bacterium]
MKAPVPASESARLEALRRYHILDTSSDDDFDVLVALAARICGTPIGLVSLVDADRQWFKARIGLESAETPRDVSFCAHAILGSELFVVPDATADARFADNPFVTSDPHIRFYAGAPLVTPDGHALGTLCVIDHEPHDLSPHQAQVLRALSRQVVSLLELRRTRKDLEQALNDMQGVEEAQRTSQQLQTRMIESSRDCIKLLDADGRLLSMNQGGMEILEICDFEPLRNTFWLDFWEGPHREAASRALEEAKRGGVGRFVGFCPTMGEKPMWWDVVVNAIVDAQGRPEQLLAISRDVTERVRSERTLRAISEGTAAATGDDFFRSLVRHLAMALDVRYAFVAECLDAGRSRARTLAFWNGNEVGRDFEYDLEGTPCQTVVGGQIAYHPSQLRSLFPEDQALVELSAESYLGLPLLDAQGRVMGHLVVMNDRPMEEMPRLLAVLKVFTARAAAELQRVRADDEVRALNRELDSLLAMNRAIGRHLDRDELFGALAWSLRSLVPTDRFGIELPIEGDKLQGHILIARTAQAEPTQPTVLPAAGTACDWVIQRREWVITGSRDELRESFPVTFDVMLQEGMESLCAMPLVSGDRSRGALFFMAAEKGAYENVRRTFLEQVVGAVSVALGDCLAHEELRRLRDRLEAENVYLQEEIRTQHGFEEIIGQSVGLRRLLAQVEQVAPTDATVLITGETGTGKELLARAIHALSPRRERPLVVVNCGAISAGLVESELFGHEKGAFTGATARKVGRFELAHGGSIFLDEIGDLPLDLQVKLLRVLQEGEIERVGGTATIRVDVRVIAATNRDLAEAVGESRFRSDLFYRLNVFPVHVPALRERREDIPSLARYFLLKEGPRLGKALKRIPQRTMNALVAYDWPGNVRELRNVIERSIITSAGDGLELGDWVTGAARPADVTAIRAPIDGDRTLAEVERDHIFETLRRAGWVVSGPRGAAALLGLKPTTLEARMKKLGIARPHIV